MSTRLRSAALAVVMLISPAMARGQSASPSVPDSFVTTARRLVAAATDAWPARRAALRALYAGDGARPLWTSGGRTTAQAREVVALLRGVDERGLDPRDYGPAALEAMRAGVDADDADVGDAARLARFDVALSRTVVRLIADLHAGRANPRGLGFDLPDAHRGLNLAELVIAASRAPDPRTVVDAAEPPYAGYAALKQALARYRALAADAAIRPPAPTRAALRPGDPYADAPALGRLLVALGDLPAGAADSLAGGAAAGIYTPALAGGVAAFQRRHALDADSVAGPATMAALRVPLARRVRQIELTLERWRWMPDVAPARYAVVNVPAFRLYVFEDDATAAHPALRMNVIVGRAGRRATPAFVGTMREVVFRPYWDVPPSIARKETVPDIRRKPGYFEREELEIVRGGDEGAVVYPPTGANLDRVLGGTLRIRQRPGPKNALGLVKFVFPNEYNVYLHGTPAQELFAETRRDFSHGCIRVEDPTSLAELVLRGQDGWDRAAIEAAMQGARTQRVKLERPVTVYVLYATAVAGTDGAVRFYPDLYGRDRELERALTAAAGSRSSALAARREH